MDKEPKTISALITLATAIGFLITVLKDSWSFLSFVGCFVTLFLAVLAVIQFNFEYKKIAISIFICISFLLIFWRNLNSGISLSSTELIVDSYKNKYLRLVVINKDAFKDAACNLKISKLIFPENSHDEINVKNIVLATSNSDNPYTPQNITSGQSAIFDLIYIEEGSHTLQFPANRFHNVYDRRFPPGVYTETVYTSGPECGSSSKDIKFWTDGSSELKLLN